MSQITFMKKILLLLVFVIPIVPFGLPNQIPDIQYNKTILEYEEKIKANPADANLYYELGNIYYKEKQYQSALSYFQKAEELYKYKGDEATATAIEALKAKLLREQFDELEKRVKIIEDKLIEIERKK